MNPALIYDLKHPAKLVGVADGRNEQAGQISVVRNFDELAIILGRKRRRKQVIIGQSKGEAADVDAFADKTESKESSDHGGV